MTKEQVLSTIAEYGVIAVIRLNDASKLAKVIESVRVGDVKCIEITMTVPGAVESIRALSKSMPADVLIGAGTVTSAAIAEDVIAAGAQFVVSPVLDLTVIEVCKRHNVACMPGCYTPTEIFTAWNAGADVCKVFPATSLGPKYFKDLAGPFPHIKLMPTGGVTIDNVGEWIAAGAVAVGIGSDLLDKKAIDEGRFEVLTERAAHMYANVIKAKQLLKK